jgi:hypothetical protein
LFEGPPIPYCYKTFLMSHLSVQSKSLGLCGITKLRDPCSSSHLAHVLSLAIPLSLGFTLNWRSRGKK